MFETIATIPNYVSHYLRVKYACASKKISKTPTPRSRSVAIFARHYASHDFGSTVGFSDSLMCGEHFVYAIVFVIRRAPTPREEAPRKRSVLDGYVVQNK